MKELPTPTFEIASLKLLAKAQHRTVPQPVFSQNASAQPALCGAGIVVSWARHQDEVREAQRLRYAVFAGEMGAVLPRTIPGHDVDLFDDFCEHLLVRDASTRHVIGTYRLLTPAQARRVGSTYADTEFDLTRLRDVRARMVELGRSCVHHEHRHGGVIMALWGALTTFMVRNQFDIMVGCASLPMRVQGTLAFSGSAHAAASIWRKLHAQHMAPVDWHVYPRLALPIELLDSTLDVQPPPLIKGYLRLGAKVLGPPAWDPDFSTADLPMMMRISELPERYRKHFLAGT